jgi:hypothetical protein
MEWQTVDKSPSSAMPQLTRLLLLLLQGSIDRHGKRGNLGQEDGLVGLPRSSLLRYSCSMCCQDAIILHHVLVFRALALQ